MLLLLFTAFGLVHDPLTASQLPFDSMDTWIIGKLRRRTEAEWICTRCRLPAEGSYCTRCGQVYEKPIK